MIFFKSMYLTRIKKNDTCILLIILLKIILTEHKEKFPQNILKYTNEMCRQALSMRGVTI